ncbi:MAG: hypothetical protein A2017_12270 [Lentisphaerae bacterium GWF2_44_16]|nr:MAG: hypothetical protein A2017_12270 [Lentisphaerae bacterium GWF2_44_16]
MKSTDKKKEVSRLVISCGGTGGHFYPGLTIARTFKEQGGKVMLLLSGKHAESQAETAGKFGIPSAVVPLSVRSSNIFRILLFLKNLAQGTVKARIAMKNFRPDAILTMGSFTSIPAALAGMSLKVPLFIHEGNARLGRANQYLSRYARQMALSFPLANPQKCKCLSTVTGMPVRPELLRDRPERKEALFLINSRYGTDLKNELPLLLIFGGSQGAAVFNNTVPEALLKQEEYNFQVIHLTGAGHIEKVKKVYENAGFPRLVIEKSEDMGLFYAASDMVLSRAGGSTISELAVFGRYAVLVPYPYAADRHQDDNAAYHAETGGAQVLANEECTVEALSVIIKDWRLHSEKYLEKGVAASINARPEASEAILRLIGDSL